MYERLWQVLPGPTAAKVVQCLALFVAVVVVLFGWVFPKVEPLLPFIQVTVGAGEISPAPLSERMLA